MKVMQYGSEISGIMISNLLRENESGIPSPSLTIIQMVLFSLLILILRQRVGSREENCSKCVHSPATLQFCRPFVDCCCIFVKFVSRWFVQRFTIGMRLTSFKVNCKTGTKWLVLQTEKYERVEINKYRLR